MRAQLFSPEISTGFATSMGQIVSDWILHGFYMDFTIVFVVGIWKLPSPHGADRPRDQYP